MKIRRPITAPPQAASQTWRTFLENHLKTMVSVDVFVASAIRFLALYVFLAPAHGRISGVNGRNYCRGEKKSRHDFIKLFQEP